MWDDAACRSPAEAGARRACYLDMVTKGLSSECPPGVTHESPMPSPMFLYMWTDAARVSPKSTYPSGVLCRHGGVLRRDPKHVLPQQPVAYVTNGDPLLFRWADAACPPKPWEHSPPGVRPYPPHPDPGPATDIPGQP